MGYRGLFIWNKYNKFKGNYLEDIVHSNFFWLTEYPEYVRIFYDLWKKKHSKNIRKINNDL